jgi:hypothetical protein
MEAVMSKWLTGITGTVLMILTWTVGWGLGFGGLMELYDPHGQIGDVWPTALAIPGFIGGVVFSALFRIAEGRRGFVEVSLTRVALWGAATGLVLGGIAVAAGLNLPPAATMGLATTLSTFAAIGSAVFFRLVAWGPSVLAGEPS